MSGRVSPRSALLVLAFTVLAVSALSVLPGCGSGQPYSMRPVSGKVKTERGGALPPGGIRLRFTPKVAPIDAKTHPRPGAALTAADGTFAEVTTMEFGDGLVVGKHQVEAFPAGSSTSPFRIQPAEIEVGSGSTEFEFTIMGR
jgi:hypothetical protein